MVSPTEEELEDFGTLLDEFMSVADISQFLAEKEYSENSDQQSPRKGKLGKKDIAHYFQLSLEQEGSGLLEEAYLSLETIMKDGRISSPRTRHYVLKNLADLAVQLFGKSDDAQEKIMWIDRAYRHFGMLREHNYGEETRRSKIHTAAQLGRSKYKHLFFVEGVEERRRLATEAIKEFESIKGLELDDSLGRFWCYDLSQKPIRILETLTDDKDEKHDWASRRYDEAIEGIELARQLERERSVIYFSECAGSAAASLAELESDPDSRIDWLEKSYKFRLDSINSENQENGADIYINVGFSALTAREIAKLTKDPEKKRQWFLDSYELSRRGADLAAKNQDPQNACQNLICAAESAGKLMDLDQSHRVHWKKARFNTYLASAYFALNYDNISQAGHSFNFAADTAREMASFSGDEEEKIKWLEKALRNYTNCVRFYLKAGNLVNTSHALAYMGNVLLELAELVDGDERVKLLEMRMNAYYNSGHWGRIGRDLRQASHSYAFAGSTVDLLLKHHSMVPRRRELLRKKLDAYRSSAEIAKEASQQGGRVGAIGRHAFYTFSIASDVAAELTELGDADSPWELVYDLKIESANLAQELGNLRHSFHAYGFAADVAEKISQTKTEPVERTHWLQRCYEDRMKSAEVALRDNNLRHAAYILGYASTSAQQILDLAPHDKEWGTKAYTASLEAAELFMKMGYTSRAANSYRQAADIALRLGDESDIWERRSQACWDKYLELK